MNIAGDFLIAFATYGLLALCDRLFGLGGTATEPVVLIGLVLAIIGADYFMRLVRR